MTPAPWVLALWLAAGVDDGSGRPAPLAGHDRLSAVVADIEAGRRVTPIVGEPTADGQVPVTFLARRQRGRAPRIVSDVTGWGEHVDGTFDVTTGRMTRVGRSEWFALETLVEPGARIEYLLAYGVADYRPDPYNPRRVGPPPASEFVTAGYEPPEESTWPPPVRPGTLEKARIDSHALGGSRRVVLYQSQAVDVRVPVPVAVFLDPRATEVAPVLDKLVERGLVPPLVAAFVALHEDGRIPDTSATRAFLNQELPEWLERRGFISERGHRAIVAISFGAKDAMEAALAPAGAFGSVALLIPGRRLGSADLAVIRATRGPRLHTAILAGRYDQANLATARGLRQALTDAGHTVDYVEVPEGHSPRTWMHHLGRVLVAVFGVAPQARRMPPDARPSRTSRTEQGNAR